MTRCCADIKLYWLFTSTAVSRWTLQFWWLRHSSSSFHFHTHGTTMVSVAKPMVLYCHFFPITAIFPQLLSSSPHNFVLRSAVLTKDNKLASKPQHQNVCLCHCNIQTSVHIGLSWPWPLISDLDNLSSSSHSHGERLCRVLSESLH